MRLEFHPKAELEFIEAAAYYELGVAVDDDLRKFVLQRFPFSLIYR